MTYQGTVKNGVVVFEAEPPPEGTPVRVEAVEQRADHEGGSIWDRMSELAGRAPELPEGAALDHDHYLYGKPKR